MSRAFAISMKFVHLNTPDLAGVSSPPICANHSATGAYEVKKNPSCCVQSVLVLVFRPIANKNTVGTTNGFSRFFRVSWRISQCTSSRVRCRHTALFTCRNRSFRSGLGRDRSKTGHPWNDEVPAAIIGRSVRRRSRSVLTVGMSHLLYQLYSLYILLT